MNPQVELIYDAYCPNIGAARTLLVEAFRTAEMAPRWREYAGNSAECPAHARGYGSPTILINGVDVGGSAPQQGSPSCRVYDNGNGVLRGTPSLAKVVDALKAAAHTPGARSVAGSWRTFAALPGIGAAMLPVGACPACLPAYAGIVGSLGLGFLLESAYLLPVVAGFLGLTLLSFAYRARQRRGFGPLILGAFASGLILGFKFWRPNELLFYVGLLVLVAASFWNVWPGRSKAPACPACAPQAFADQPLSAPKER